MRVSVTGPQFADPERVKQLIQGSVRRIRAVSGVEAAAATCCVPLERLFQAGFQIPGRGEGIAGSALVSAGYFETFKIPVLRGRLFAERDETGPPVVIINQTLAKQFWADGDPLNDRIQIGESPAQIVGVVGDVRDRGLTRDPRPTVYTPTVTPGEVLQSDPWTWVIRTRDDPRSIRAALENELREASGGLPVAGVRTMTEILSRSTAAQDFNTLVMTIFGCSALLLAAIGVYGLMAYSVAQRVQEIGIRVALGAESGEIRRMVVFQGLRPVLAGVICGLAAAFGLTRLLAGLLFGVKAWDPLVFSVVPAILMGVALVAVSLPAMRASRIDPIRALRTELY
jgi:putative ABC transport system permease protein